MTVTWDASTGKAPWTVVVAPVGQLPVSVTIPSSSSSSSLSWSWDVPSYSTSGQVIVAVSDSSGAISGTSSLENFAVASSARCKGPSQSLDFVWYTSETKLPTACGTFPVHWQADRSNNGIVPPVQFVLLAEKQAPVQYSAGARDTMWNMPVTFDAGTKFVIAAFDDGKSGTGGVGDVFTVGRKTGRCASDAAPSGSAGLVPGTSTASPQASSTSTNKTHTAGSGNAKSIGGASTNAKPTTTSTGVNGSSNATASESSSSHSKGGVIAGAVLGCLAAAAIVVGAIVYWRKKKPSEEGSSKGWPTGDVMPWRWEVVDNEKREERGAGGAAAPPPMKRWSSDYGHGLAEGSSFKVFNVRKPVPGTNAMPEASSSEAFASGAVPTSSHVSKPSLSSRNIYSVVPDDSLFPPPAMQKGSNRSPASATLPGLERPAFAKVVPDSMLFPPPAPSQYRSPSVGTPMDGTGAGVGTYAAMARQPDSLNRPGASYFPNQHPNQAADAFVPGRPGQSLTQGASLVSQHPQRQQDEDDGGHLQASPLQAESESSRIDARKVASPSRYIPPQFPVTTSIHDPYSHMSQVYNGAQVRDHLSSYERDNAPSVPKIPNFYLSDGNDNVAPPLRGHLRDVSQGSASGRLPPSIYPGSRGRADSPANAQGHVDGPAPTNSRPRDTMDSVEGYGILPYL